MNCDLFYFKGNGPTIYFTHADIISKGTRHDHSSSVTLKRGENISYQFAAGRRAYLVSTIGAADIDGLRLAPRDGVAIVGQPGFELAALEDTEILMVEVF